MNTNFVPKQKKGGREDGNTFAGSTPKGKKKEIIRPPEAG